MGIKYFTSEDVVRDITIILLLLKTLHRETINMVYTFLKHYCHGCCLYVYVGCSKDDI